LLLPYIFPQLLNSEISFISPFFFYLEYINKCAHTNANPPTFYIGNIVKPYLSFVTFQGNIKIGSHKTGGR